MAAFCEHFIHYVGVPGIGSGGRVLKINLTAILCKIIEDKDWWQSMCVCVCLRGATVCLCVSTGMPTIFRKLFGISGAVHPSAAEKNQTLEYKSLPTEKWSGAK